MSPTRSSAAWLIVNRVTDRDMHQQSNQPKELEMREIKKSDRRIPRPTPALIVAFVALFAAIGGFGYAAAKVKPNSVKTRNIKNAAVTTDKIADGAVTTPKLAPDAVAPNATNAVNATNAAKLGGAAPGECQTGWLKASLVVDTSGLTDATPDGVVPGFDCASKAANPVSIHRNGTGRYTLTVAGIDSGVAISSSANVGGGAANVVTAASKVDAQGKLNLTVWNNGDAALVDGKTVSLIVF
jgi:hypothetical protein